MDLRRLLLGPRGTALRAGAPVVLASFAAAALTTTLFLSSGSAGGVYWPLDAALIALAASAAYAARYRAAVVCLAVGAAAFVGSDVGFHALHGNDAVLGTLVLLAGRTDVLGAGALFGAVGGVVGAVVGHAVRFWRARA